MMRWGVLTRASADAGPFKLGEFDCEGKPVVAFILESTGVQSNPVAGSLAMLFFPEGDDGRAFAIVGPPPARRIDQQKAGETTLVNHETGNAIQHRENGDTVVTTAGVFHVNPP